MDGVAAKGIYDYDLFTIGAGSGGVRASRTAAGFGAKVVICELAYNPISSESEGGIGGTCVLRGCVPKKILMYGSTFSADFQDAKGYGWQVPDDIKHDWKALIENKGKEIQRLNGVYKKLLTGAGVSLLEGEAKLVDAHRVEVKEPSGATKSYTAKHILIATGSRAVLLNIPGKEYGITSDEALCLAESPKRVVIVGGGYIAVEFAGIFNGTGSTVDLVYRAPTPLRGFDEEMRAIVADNLQKRGVRVHPNTNPTKIEKAPGGGYILQTDKGEPILADIVMFATGRKPNTKRLNLDAVGVEVDSIGAIKVDEYSKTAVDSIYAIGDCTNRLNLTPVALMEGTAFAKTVFDGKPTKPDYENVPSAVFCQPPLAVVGLTENQALEKATSDLKIFVSSFTPMKNQLAGRQEKTVMKLLVDSATDKVVGASMVGPDSAEIMQSIGVALKCGATKAQFDSCVGIHPTAAEEFVTMRNPTRILPPKNKEPAANLMVDTADTSRRMLSMLCCSSNQMVSE